MSSARFKINPQKVFWHYAPEVSPCISSWLSEGGWETELELVKFNCRRSVYRCPGSAEVSAFYLKYDHPQRLRDRIKGLWRCKAEKEFQAILVLCRAGVPTARPIAWGEAGADAILVTEELIGAQEFNDAWKKVRDVPEMRSKFMAHLAAFLRCLAGNGVDHPDLHTGNVLLCQEEERMLFFLMDPYGVRIGKQIKPVELFVWLTSFGRDLSHAEIVRLVMQSGLAEEDGEAYRLWLAAVKLAGRLANRRWRGRRKRLLRSSSLCEVVFDDFGKWRLLKTFSLTVARQAIDEHRQNVACGKILKDDVKRRLTRVTVKDQRLVVKEFIAPGPWGRLAADCRSWLNTCRLAMGSQPVAACRGWLRDKEGHAFIVLDDVGELCLPELLYRTSVVQCLPLLEVAVRIIARFHQRQIWHRDLKSTNFVVSGRIGEVQTLRVIDTDDVRFGVRIGLVDRAFNLKQFFAALEGCIGKKEIRHLVVVYGQECGFSRSCLRLLLKRIYMKENA